jgi:hypothetical protein
MYELIDTFNNIVISRHRTIKAAAKADNKHDRAVKRNNGPNSYIPTRCRDEKTKKWVDGDEWLEAMSQLPLPRR